MRATGSDDEMTDDISWAYGLENLVVTGRISGSKSTGRPRNKYMDIEKEMVGGFRR